MPIWIMRLKWLILRYSSTWDNVAALDHVHMYRKIFMTNLFKNLKKGRSREQLVIHGLVIMNKVFFAKTFLPKS